MLCVFINTVGYTKEVLRTSVSPEFPNGLHVKYLEYIAEKLDIDLVLNPLPFGRRVVELTNGNLDLIVGIQKNMNKEDDFILLDPSYESIKNTFFVKSKDRLKFESLDALKQATIAATIRVNYFPNLSLEHGPVMVRVSTLTQKIGLLEKGRVDGFMHFAPSTLKTLNSITTKDTIVPSSFQPEKPHSYYFALSKSSKFVNRISELEKIIKTGKQNGDFQKIRKQHYHPQSDS